VDPEDRVLTLLTCLVLLEAVAPLTATVAGSATWPRASLGRSGRGRSEAVELQALVLCPASLLFVAKIECKSSRDRAALAFAKEMAPCG